MPAPSKPASTTATRDASETRQPSETRKSSSVRAATTRAGSTRFNPPTGSWADDLWQRWNATDQGRRRTEWIIVGVITLIAALVRFIRLGEPGRIVFDEVYYVMDGWTLSNLGYEAEWPEEQGKLWEAGNHDAYRQDPSYVVHPPLGKYLIGWGIHIFGAENVFAWRAAVAIFGTLAVPLLYLVGRQLFRTVAMAAIPAAFLAIDGHAIVVSRVSILDVFVMFFALLGFYFILRDRDTQRTQILEWVRQWRIREHAKDPSVPLENTPSKWSFTVNAPKERPTGPDWGPVLWRRPWLIAAAAALACCIAVKWSGLYFLAFFCLFTIALDAATRKEAGITQWLSGAVLKQGPVSFLLTIPLTGILYLLSYAGWFITGKGYNGIVATGVWDGNGSLWDWLKLSWEHFMSYQTQILEFHSRLSAGHPYNSSPWEWPFLLRPTAFSYNYIEAGTAPECMDVRCVEAVTSISNPIIFWLGTISIMFLLMLMFVKPTWQYAAILVGYFAGYLPWLLTGRTSVYHFYVIAWLPFMLLASAYAIQTVLGKPTDDRRDRTRMINIVAGFFVVVILVSAFFYPTWTGMRIPEPYFELTHWLKGWK
ncbi:dolichyl-phosphate-mannose--protein mannosyltransferase [Gulosibacter bifidus]|uniref:Polyprenol-phosphate-mannose--protein mannosyltransferase n=1 Tax=Gulosibacter bifidus TaxID=272239 RepID=A0ABW5RJY8_9MICO|nr:phospholipid carrier-dependent glycosyltransferase [Gulosibacter bifidus]